MIRLPDHPSDPDDELRRLAIPLHSRLVKLFDCLAIVATAGTVVSAITLWQEGSKPGIHGWIGKALLACCSIAVTSWLISLGISTFLRLRAESRRDLS
ncbi:hypothetical protein [Haloferula sargassicola]|uniref:Uncharacterized protein n=1 Tax=Haloferula sargassicola TaxID=490096 RepID=A0ABP9UV45_9BACT